MQFQTGLTAEKSNPDQRKIPGFSYNEDPDKSDCTSGQKRRIAHALRDWKKIPKSSKVKPVNDLKIDSA